MSTTPKSQEIAVPIFSEKELASFESFDDVLKHTIAKDIQVDNISIYGSGFVVLDSKEKLIENQFVILEYHFSQGKQGEFVSLLIMARNPVTVNGKSVSKLVVNDGSTGIRDQMRMIEERRTENGVPLNRPIFVENGLRKSTYTIEVNGEETEATTFYLAT